MSRYHGKSGRVMLSTTASAAAVTTTMSGWTLNRATDRAETTSFGDANKTYVQGLPDLQGTLTGFVDNADDRLFDAAESADGAKLYLYFSTDALAIYFYGPAWVDASIEVPVAGAVTMNGTFAANGSWGRQWP
jgi:hypothetical protein